ncbi:hypothetical protein [Xenorhabdus bovienii]|uniref:hypothetical protein n=1 Tax=Xenorhabdus bovienii TaxID=40576 RepID=UPI003DA5D777
MRIIMVCFILLFCAGKALAATPQNYLYASSGQLEELRSLLARPDISGVQIVYTWQQLEKSKGEYDFSAIEKDLSILNKMNKKLFIQIQDRFFEPNNRNIPLYLLQESQYNGGLIAQSDNPGEGQASVQGWVSIQWNTALRERYQHLLAALATSFDGRIIGINLPETAIDIDMKKANADFTCDKYFSATIDNIIFARKVFKKSYVVQYVNFWPCEWNNECSYMSRLFDIAQKNNIGLGGPDIVPYKKAQMKNSYPFFHRYKNKLNLVAMAVQEPTLTYTNSQTKKKFTQQEFIKFAEEYLGANIIFWSASSPWLSK